MPKQSRSATRQRRPDLSSIRARVLEYVDAVEEAARQAGHPDQELLARAAIAGELARQRAALFASPVRAEDEERLSDVAAGLHAQAQAPLARLAETPARTMDGLQAQAAVWLAWSYGTTIFALPTAPAEDRLLVSLLLGLLDAGPGTKPYRESR